MIFAVIVTYGDRYNLLKQVLTSCIKEGVTKIIVVSNNSDDESCKNLKKLENELNGVLKVIYLKLNTGSAGGFNIGIAEAYRDIECKYIWLLDDDNMPESNSLNILKIKINENLENESIAFLSYRAGRDVYRLSFNTNNVDNIIGGKNDFLGIGFRTILLKLLRKFTGCFQLPIKEDKNLAIAPYGGLLFHRSVIDKIGLPNKKYVLYGDDFEFTYRMFLADIKIKLLEKSKIQDIDQSIFDTRNQSKFYYTLIDSDSDFRIYYSVRNSIQFSKTLRSDNKVNLFINSILFFTLLICLSIIKRKPKRFFLIIKAVKDGLLGNLGISKEFNLK